MREELGMLLLVRLAPHPGWLPSWVVMKVPSGLEFYYPVANMNQLSPIVGPKWEGFFENGALEAEKKHSHIGRLFI